MNIKKSTFSTLPINVTDKIVQKQHGIFLLLLCSIFVTELLIMLLLPHFNTNNSIISAFIDAGILVLVLYPVIMILVVHPLKNLQRERDHLEENTAIIFEQFNNMASRTDGVFIQLQLNADGSYQIPFVNSGIKTIYHQTQENLSRDPTLFFSQIHPDDISQFKKVIAISAQKLTGFVHEYRLNLPSGKECKLSLSAMPQQSSDGTILFNGYIKPVAENHELRLLRNIAADVFKDQFGLVVTDRFNNIKQINQAFSTITGYSAQEAVNKNMRLIGSKHHDVEFYNFIWKSVETKGCWQGEIWNRRKNGQLYLQHTLIFPIKNDRNEIVSYAGVIHDITSIYDTVGNIGDSLFYQHIGSGLL